MEKNINSNKSGSEVVGSMVNVNDTKIKDSVKKIEEGAKKTMGKKVITKLDMVKEIGILRKENEEGWIHSTSANRLKRLTVKSLEEILKSEKAAIAKIEKAAKTKATKEANAKKKADEKAKKADEKVIDKKADKKAKKADEKVVETKVETKLKKRVIELEALVQKLEAKLGTKGSKKDNSAEKAKLAKKVRTKEELSEMKWQSLKMLGSALNVKTFGKGRDEIIKGIVKAQKKNKK